jgi:hypothetical protein
MRKIPLDKNARAGDWYQTLSVHSVHKTMRSRAHMRRFSREASATTFDADSAYRSLQLRIASEPAGNTGNQEFLRARDHLARRSCPITPPVCSARSPAELQARPPSLVQAARASGGAWSFASCQPSGNPALISRRSFAADRSGYEQPT